MYYFLKLFLKRLLHGLKKIIVYNSLKIINNSNVARAAWKGGTR